MDDKSLLYFAAQAATANPFEEHRDNLDFSILGRKRGTLTPTQVLSELANALEPALTRAKLIFPSSKFLAETNTNDAFNDERENIRKATLFALFHRFLPDIDNYAILQTEQNAPLKTPFAAKLFASLSEYGASTQKARHYVALFYQLRRAFLNIINLLSGNGPSISKLRVDVWNAIFTVHLDLHDSAQSGLLRDFPILLTGETGTGKSSVARIMGLSGYTPYDVDRGFATPFSDLFVPLNIAALTESLFEAELFGVRKGAFTGAQDDRAGLLAQCKLQSILFLDEIGELPERMQVKLLGVLQERRFRALGDTKEQAFVGRIISATHKDVGALLSSGRMREDFFYRICAGTLHMPSLKTRLHEEDSLLEDLVTDALERVIGKGNAADLIKKTIVELHRGLPKNYQWPGNVRELEQRVRQFLLTGTIGDFPSSNASLTAEFAPLIESAKKERENMNDIKFETMIETLTQQSCSIDKISSSLARRYLKTEGTYEKAARKAGVDWRTLKKLANSSAH